MRFIPVSEEVAAGCLPKGEYEAVVKASVEKISKAENPMIELTLTVYGSDGQEGEVRDWLVATDGGQGKIQRFCKSADLWGTYQAGELCAESCVGLNVTVKLKVQESDDYAPRNAVVDYLPRKIKADSPEPSGTIPGVSAEQRAASVGGEKKPLTDDGIPF